MYSCPACGAEDVANKIMCACGADLSLLQRIDAVADVWFNRALEALAEGTPGRALEWLSACCVARPTDAAALRAQAKLWAQLGHWEEARDALDRAAAIDPDAPELELIRQALRDGTNPVERELPGDDVPVATVPASRATRRRTTGTKNQKKAGKQARRPRT